MKNTNVWNGCKGSLRGSYFKVVGTKGSVGCWCVDDAVANQNKTLVLSKLLGSSLMCMCEWIC